MFRSDFFGRTDTRTPYPVDGPGAAVLVTGGFQVRGFPLLTDPVPSAGLTDLRKTLATTWDELFNSLAAVYGLGWGVEWALSERGRLTQVIRVEPLSYWYNKEVILDLTDVGAIADTLTIEESRHYQVIELGYDKWQAGQANGLDEFNAKRQWTTPLTVTSNTYSQISTLSASGILLETTRRDRFDEKATTDTSNDATNFLVCLLRTVGGGFETERNQQAVRLEGVLSPETIYNLRLSPARLLRTHAAALRGCLPFLDKEQVRFTQGEGNVTMVSQLLGESAPITENANLAVSELENALWTPERVEITAPVKRQQITKLLMKPNGRVRYRGADRAIREGWILEVKYEGGQATFTLLPCLT
jgi:hypothetical protein